MRKGMLITASHTYSEPGQFEILATVTDDDGGTGSRRTTVLVAPLPADQMAAAGAELTTD
jgi:hypothetical protein